MYEFQPSALSHSSKPYNCLTPLRLPSLRGTLPPNPIFVAPKQTGDQTMASGGQTILQFPQASTNLTARIHPLVIFNICDCFVRRPDQAERVIGTLLGSVLPDGTVDIRNSYAVPHNESSDQVFFRLSINFAVLIFRSDFSSI